MSNNQCYEKIKGIVVKCIEDAKEIQCAGDEKIWKDAVVNCVMAKKIPNPYESNKKKNADRDVDGLNIFFENLDKCLDFESSKIDEKKLKSHVSLNDGICDYL